MSVMKIEEFNDSELQAFENSFKVLKYSKPVLGHAWQPDFFYIESSTSHSKEEIEKIRAEVKNIDPKPSKDFTYSIFKNNSESKIRFLIVNFQNRPFLDSQKSELMMAEKQLIAFLNLKGFKIS